jgi:dTDP-4-amino-4,6-dideoxygalactose transaminase
MPAVISAAEDAPVLEDTAHAPLSYFDGRMVGSFGAARFYSFASTKYWPAGGGGLIIVNDATLAPPLEAAIRSLTPVTRLKEFRSLLLQAAKALVFQRELYGVCGRPIRRWVENLALLEPVLGRSVIHRPWAAVACRQAKRMAARVERQRINSLQLLARLSTRDDVVLPRERPRAQYNYHLFPVLLGSHEERKAMMASMWARFVDTSMIYSGAVQQAVQFGYDGGCPVAESVTDRLITLPNYAGLTTKEIDYVAEVFLSSLSLCRPLRIKPERQAESALETVRF